VTAAVEVWWVYETYSHCFLIIPISLWLIWDKREVLGRMQPAVEWRALWLVPIVLVVWAIGELATINEVRQFAIVGMIQVAILAILGVRVYRVIWFSALYLFFLVPTGQYLIGPMQSFATQFVDASFNLLGLPHHTEGTLIELTNGNFEIAEACAGLRFLIATMALGVLFAYLMFRKWYKVGLFLIACIAVPLIGNGLRIVGIILLAHYTNNAYGAGADHLVYGWGFNVAILLILFLLGSFFRDPISDRSEFSSQDFRIDSSKKIVAVLVAASFIISLGPAAAWWRVSRVVAASASPLLRPLDIGGWHASKMVGYWHPSFPDADAHIALSLRPDQLALERPVDLYVGYYIQARTGHTLTAHINHLWDGGWVLVNSRVVKARLNGQDVQVQEWVINSLVERRIIWACYWIDGRFAADLLTAKYLQARATLEGHQGQALVAISTVVEGTDVEAEHRLSNALAALRNLPDRLAAADRGDKDPRSSN
jgi:exosortase A